MQPEATEQDAQRKESSLPPDGTIIRVSPRRRQTRWIGAGLFGLFAFCVTLYAFQAGRPTLALASLGYVLAAFGFGRLALGGVVLGDRVRARSFFKTFTWQWEEIKRFELRQRGETPRLRVHLKDGTTRSFLGFFAQTSSEEARADELLEALQVRLQNEQARR
jgi:hypothetical protein